MSLQAIQAALYMRRQVAVVRSLSSSSSFAAEQQQQQPPITKKRTRRPIVHVPQTNKPYRNKNVPNNYLITAGLPLILFSLLSAWVVSNALEGKNKERDISRGTASISLRQHQLQQEHDEMMEKLNAIVTKDQEFDNTKRVKRPEEVLEERRLERERRNVWYRRWWRWVVAKTTTQQQQQN